MDVRNWSNYLGTGTRIVSLLLSALLTATAYGQATPGENFNALLDINCVNPPVELVPLCDEFVRDGGSGGPGGGVGGNNNLDSVGSQNQTTGDKSQRGKIFLSQGWGLFGSVNVGNRSRNATRLENGYDGDEIGVAIGVDKSLSDKMAVGLVVGQSSFEADLDLGSGSLESDTESATLFLTYDHDEASSINLYVGRDKTDYDSVRNITVTTEPKQASSNTDATQTTAGVDLYFSWPKDAWLFGASVNINYLDSEIDAFEEFSTLGNTSYLLSYPDQDIESLTVSAGFEIAYSASLSWGVLVPQGRIAYVRETENESRDITTTLVVAPDFSFVTTTDDADKQYFVASLGTSAVFGDDWQLFADATTIVGNDLVDGWAINIGFHKQF